MQIFSKILTPTDVEVRMSFPTAVMREWFRLNQGQQLDIQVMDNSSGELFTFRLSTRNKGHPKPVLTGGWIDFVNRKELRQNDKVIFLRQGDQFQIRGMRWIQLMGAEFWGEISTNPN